MAFFVHTHPGVDQHILSIEGLSDEGKETVIREYLKDLAEHADHFLARSPMAHESYTFEYEFSLIDGGRLFEFRFIADGSSMGSASVVQVLYVDHEVTLLP